MKIYIIQHSYKIYKIFFIVEMLLQMYIMLNHLNHTIVTDLPRCADPINPLCIMLRVTLENDTMYFVVESLYRKSCNSYVVSASSQQ